MIFSCRAVLFSIVALVTGFLGLGVRAFATADIARFIFFAAFVISVAVLVLYFMLRRSAREPMAPSLYGQPPFMKALPLPALDQRLKGTFLASAFVSPKHGTRSISTGKWQRRSDRSKSRRARSSRGQVTAIQLAG
jgi:uncharacterized membrane protein YtjA (UPF0391 family)